MRGDGPDQIARDVQGEVDRALGRTVLPTGMGQDRLAPGRAFTVLGLVLCGQEQQARAVLMQMTPAERTDLRLALVTLLRQEQQVQSSMDLEESDDERSGA